MQKHSASSSSLQEYSLLIWLLCPLLAIGFLSYSGLVYSEFDTPKRLILSVSVSLFAIIVSSKALYFRTKTDPSATVYSYKLNNLDLAIALYVILAVCSSLWAESRYYALIRLTPHLSAALLYYVIRSYNSQRDLLIIIIGIYSAASINSLLGIFQYANGFEGIPQAAAPAGLFGNRNPSAHFTAFALTAGLYVFYPRRKLNVIKLALFYPTFSTLVAYLVICASRNALLSTIIAVFIYILLILTRKQNRKNTLILVKHITLASLLGVLLSFIPSKLDHSAWSMIQSKIERSASDIYPATKESPIGISKSARYYNWINTLPMLLEKPLGVGIGNWEVAYPRFSNAKVHDQNISLKKSPIRAHNDYIQALAETGVLTVLPGLLLAYTLITNTLRYFRDKLGKYDELLPLGVALIVCYCIISMFSFPAHLSHGPYLLAIGAAIYTSSLQYGEAQSSQHILSKLSSKTTGIIHILILVAAIFTALHTVEYTRAHFHFKKGMDAWFSYNQYGNALSSCNDAIEIIPQHYKSNALLAHLYAQSNTPAKALKHLLAIEREKPWLPNNLLHLAKLYSRLGMHEDSLEKAVQLIHIFPHDTLIISEAARLAVQNHFYKKGIDLIEMLIRIDPDNPEYRSTLAAVKKLADID